jgi:hypothetical protein
VTEGYGLAIFPQHAQLLEASAISPQVTREREYVSVDSRAQLKRYGKGFSNKCPVPGLLIPLHRLDGSVWGYQYRPDAPRILNEKPRKYETPFQQSGGIDIPPGCREQVTNPAVPLWITEGARKADAAVAAGLCCVSVSGVWNWLGTNPVGGKVALPDWHDIALNGRRVIHAFDSDLTVKPSVAKALRELAGYLGSKGAKTEYLHLPNDGDGKTGLDDYLAAHGAADLWSLVHPEPPGSAGDAAAPGDSSNISGKVPEKVAPDVPPMTMPQVEEVYATWLHDGDSVTTRVVHAAYVANMVLDGDPVWVLLVGGSGQGKTERLMPLAVMPRVYASSKLTGEAALLSATPKKDSAADAHGGLLRQIGDKGIIIVKDFTSTLEMDRTARGEVLAALREVYDGRWDRNVGAEGGRTLTWKGKCGFLAGCTTAIDRAHSVMNDMGPRSLLLRLPQANSYKIAGSALDHSGHEEQMRKELADATAGVLCHLPGVPYDITPAARAGLIRLASLVSQARSPVYRDYKGEIELVGDAEAPTRIVKQLGQLWRACGMLGLGKNDSWEVVRRCALDSIPKLRGAVIRYLEGQDSPADTSKVAVGVVHPTPTVRRALQDLGAHGVAVRKSAGKGHPDMWELSYTARVWTGTSGTFPEMLELSCSECGLPVDAALYAGGITVHPSCEPHDEPSQGRQSASSAGPQGSIGEQP